MTERLHDWWKRLVPQPLPTSSLSTTGRRPLNRLHLGASVGCNWCGQGGTGVSLRGRVLPTGHCRVWQGCSGGGGINRWRGRGADCGCNGSVEHKLGRQPGPSRWWGTERPARPLVAILLAARIERQTDRQTDRQIDRQKQTTERARQRNRETYRQRRSFHD